MWWTKTKICNNVMSCSMESCCHRTPHDSIHECMEKYCATIKETVGCVTVPRPKRDKMNEEQLYHVMYTHFNLNGYTNPHTGIIGAKVGRKVFKKHKRCQEHFVKIYPLFSSGIMGYPRLICPVCGAVVEQK